MAKRSISALYVNNSPSIPSPKTNAVVDLAAKRMRQLGGSFGEKRAVDMLAAPGGIGFKASDVLVLLGLDHECQSLIESLDRVKKASNECGGTSDMKRDRSLKVVRALLIVKSSFDKQRVLEKDQIEPEIDHYIEELKNLNVTPTRGMELTKMICTRIVECLSTFESQKGSQVNTLQEAEKHLSDFVVELDNYQERCRGVRDYKLGEYEKHKRSKQHADELIEEIVKKKVKSASVSAMLDVLNSCDPSVKRMVEKRKEVLELEIKARRQLTVAKAVVEFSEELKSLLMTVKSKFVMDFEKSHARFTASRERCKEKCILQLEEYIPKFGEQFLRTIQFHEKRLQASQAKVEKKQANLKNHIMLFGDEAPAEKRDLEVKINEFKGIMDRSREVMVGLVHDQEQFWSSLIFEQAPKKSYSNAVATPETCIQNSITVLEPKYNRSFPKTAIRSAKNTVVFMKEKLDATQYQESFNRTLFNLDQLELPPAGQTNNSATPVKLLRNKRDRSAASVSARKTKNRFQNTKAYKDRNDWTKAVVALESLENNNNSNFVPKVTMVKTELPEFSHKHPIADLSKAIDRSKTIEQLAESKEPEEMETKDGKGCVIS